MERDVSTGTVRPTTPWADVEWRRPSPRLRTVRRLEVGAVALLVSAVVGLFVGVDRGASSGAIASASVLALGIVTGWFVERRVRAWAYLERDEDLLVRRGVFVRRLSVIPYGRMQFIDVTAGPVERTFKLATLRMHTAAAASDARIPGLSRPEAERLRDRLAELGEAQASGL
jgi:membrane protein YdbS with pleckstrin-like domain